MCPDIADPLNGQIIFIPDELAPFQYATVATYSCEFSYGLNGNRTRVCAGDGSSLVGVWDGDAPTCDRTLTECNYYVCTLLKHTKLCTYSLVRIEYSHMYSVATYISALSLHGLI